MGPRTVIDAHLHCWDRRRFRYPWLDALVDAPERFLPEDVAEDGLRAVLVEADTAPEDALREAAWAASLTDRGVVAVVAAAPVERGDAVRPHLDRLAELPLVTGVRRLLQDEPEALLHDPALHAGLAAVAEAGLVFDACVRDRQLPALLALVRAVPGLPVVLDHLGKPPLRAGWGSERARAWHRALVALAAEPGTVVKLSGLPAEAGPGPVGPQAAPFLQAALEAFGPARAMAGSDWPVSRRAADAYADWPDGLRTGVGLSDDEADLVLRGTASAVYRIAG